MSVVVCCANCADTIEQCCRSAQWADELVVVDSGSRDDTGAIARRYADRYVVEPWRGHTGQKQFAAGLAKNDWIFFLDGDEQCTPQLAEELSQLTPQQMQLRDLLLVPRRNFVMGRRVRAWWPDRLTRIFHRGRCTWDGHVLHDTRAPSHPSRVHVLKAPIEHKRVSMAGFADYFSGKRMDERLLDVASQMNRRGRRCHWWDLIFRPRMAFWKSFVMKRGFLDGIFGLLIAQKASVSTQLKYAALWAVQQRSAEPQEPGDEAAGAGSPPGAGHAEGPESDG